MDKSTHRKILAEVLGCKESELIARYERMMPQIRNEAILTLSFEKPVTQKVDVETHVYA